MVVDSDPELRQSLKTFFEKLGFDACTVATGREALARYAAEKPLLVLLDLQLPDMDGIETLKQLKMIDHLSKVVMTSVYSKVSRVVEAIKLGAENYLTKPVPLAELRVLVNNLLESRSAVLQTDSELGGVIGKSALMQDVFRMVRRVADTSATILIRGESGTGKEMIARAIHALGSSRDKLFITVACTSIPTNLMETELFGHERGAFTDARQQKKGLLEMADGGTLFLDEIGLLPLELQAKLLNVLETQKFRRVGSTGELQVSVRFLAATNEDLEEAVKDGGFREDLYYRLNVVPIHLPPLRLRSEDTMLLSEYFLQVYTSRYVAPIRRFSEDAQQLLQAYPWPGNVRELKNVIERAVLMTEGDLIDAEDLTIDRRVRKEPSALSSAVKISGEGKIEIAFPAQGIPLAVIEEQVVQAALQHTEGNVSRAASLLHITRDMMRYRIAKYGLSEEVFPKSE